MEVVHGQKVYLPTDDVTVTIDPVTRDHWIYDGGHQKYQNSAARGMRFDEKAFQEVLGWEKGHSQGKPIEYFQPTSAMIDGMDKFAEPRLDCRGWMGQRRDPARYGELPAVFQRRYDGNWVDKGRGDIEHEMREADRRAGDRLFDKSGRCR